VQFEAEERLLQPLRPVTVPAPPSQSVTAGLAALTRIRLNDRGILGDSLTNLQPPLVELPLQLSPHELVGAGGGEAFPEAPHRRVVRRLLGVAEEALEVEAVQRLLLQLRVAEADPLLQRARRVRISVN